MKKLAAVVAICALALLVTFGRQWVGANPAPVMDGVINFGEYCNFLHVDNGPAALPGEPYDMYWDNDADDLFVAFDGSATPDPGLSPYVHHVSIFNACQMVANPDTPVVALNISTDCIVPQYFQFNSSTQMIEFVDSDDFKCSGDLDFDNSGMVTGFMTDYIIERSYPLTLLDSPPVTNPPPGAITMIDHSDIGKVTFQGGANDTRGVDGPNASQRMAFGCPAQAFDISQCAPPATATPTPTATATPILRDHYKLYIIQRVCMGGTNDGANCTEDSECPGGICSPRDGPPVNLVDQFDIETPDLGPPVFLGNPVKKDCHVCVGGSNAGANCADNSECPGGTCFSGCQPAIINNPDEHLTFYRIPEGQFGPVAVSVDNQFGRQTLTVGNPRLLAVPTQKSIQPEPLPPPIPFSINHYKCYEAQGNPPNVCVGGSNNGASCTADSECPGGLCILVVTLDDQFGVCVRGSNDGVNCKVDSECPGGTCSFRETVIVGPPFLFCNPVDKNYEGTILDPDGHLTCYEIFPGTAPPFELNVRNQFGEEVLTTGNPVALCVPSLKLSVTAPTPAPPCPTPTPTATPAPLRHFQCYETPFETFPIVSVSLADEFVCSSTVSVRRRKRVCNPADKNGEDPSAPFDPNHLTGYVIKQTEPKFVPITGVTVENQFATVVVDLVKPEYLLVPAAKSLSGPPGPLANPAVDHFKCYRVRMGKTRVPGLNITDQFGSLTFDVKKPLRLCVAADKEGSGILNPSAHLMCYKGKQTSVPKFRGIDPIFINDQFGAVKTKVDHLREFCVPSVIPAVCNGNGVVEPGEECDPPDFQGGRCTAPATSVGLRCIMNADCDSAVGSGDGQCMAHCAADEVCNATCRCQKLSCFCTDKTPPAPDPAVKLCVFPESKVGTPCADNADCDSGIGAGDGICNERQHQGLQRPLQGGWDAINRLELPAYGTLGSFPRRDSDNRMVMLSNNHVFARSSGNVPPAFPPWNATIGFEKITQPPVGPVAGTLVDYEFFCVNGGGDCTGGAQNQLNQIGNSCIDAAIADPCPDGQTVLDDGDILDVGKPAAFTPGSPATPTPPVTTATPSTPTPMPTCATSFDRTKLMDRIVKKSGARTGLTCGKITDPNCTFPIDGETYQGQFQITALPGLGFNGTTTFSCGGDSGSLVVGVATNEPIGLLFAGDNRACTNTSPPAPKTDANPIDIVLRRFKLHY